MKKYLIINSGSTSVKYALYSKSGDLLNKEVFAFDREGLKEKKEFFATFDDVERVGVRVVHGGGLVGPVIFDKEVEKKVKKFSVFAPIHNKLALEELAFVSKKFSEAEVYAFFDTDYHTTCPEENTVLPIDQELAEKYALKRYGFHGLAVESAFGILNERLKGGGRKMPPKVVFAHLGGGSSVTAVKNKKSFYNSMGASPNSGVVMKTRSGSLSADLIYSIKKISGFSLGYISKMLSDKSGIFALAGSEDTKKIFDKAKKGGTRNKKESLAFTVYLNSVVGQIFVAASRMGGVDMLVFSGGIGEGNDYLRSEVLKKVKILGLVKKDVEVVSVDEEGLIFKKLKKIK